MSDEAKTSLWIGIILVIIGIILFLILTPAGRSLWNTTVYEIIKVDDETNYGKLKEVEDTCRSMISSYTSDKLIWEQYKDSTNEEKQSWGEQAKMRANKTAATYNEYILKNSYIWNGNIPEDIKKELPYIE